MKKYDIWLVNLDPIIGSEQSGIRPCVVIHNNIFFSKQNTSLILPITGKIKESGKFRIKIKDYNKVGLDKNSTILSFQIRTTDNSRFIKKLGIIEDEKLKLEIKESIILSLDIDDEFIL